MDKPTRNLIQRATQDARRLLEREFSAQLEGIYDILPGGTILPESALRLDPSGRLVREKLVAAIGHHRAAAMTAGAALDTTVREAAFTTLNRFVALKMSEARGLVQECVSRGDQSAGFREFGSLAPGLVSLPDKGYRLYIESLWDEICREVRVLFDRRDVASLLWPRQLALDELLGILNDPQLSGVWSEDETIGWVYQYFNPEDERQAMRDPKRGGSQAPRNSRELAVRNQFFTPRYVVEFLTDNTLGRTWYEMRRGSTRLGDVCRYLVRRPCEIFLAKGEEPPRETAAVTDGEHTQDELLKEPVHIPYREHKDPRQLKILDPASGSGHFLLYCFDLLLLVYEEAWDNCPELLADLRSSLPDKTAFMRRVPSMILAHNLHGIEIDPRAAQIAELALWMRAHRAYGDMNVAHAERLPIRRTNIVVAEPMPGERNLLREFLRTIDERLQPLVTTVWERMRLAGEAGSLLKIEKEIEAAINEARVESLVDAPPMQISVFDREQPPMQEVISFASDEDRTFWDKAEERLLQALHDYTAQATGVQGMQRRLFAENAAQGFAFIDICRKRFDVVLMNPPFGEPVRTTDLYLNMHFPSSKHDVALAMVERWLGQLNASGMLGAITTRTPLFNSSSRLWRRQVLLTKHSLLACMDLGGGVLDAMVETAAYVLQPGNAIDRALIVRLTTTALDEKAGRGQAIVVNFRGGCSNSDTFIVDPTIFQTLPNSPLAYWLPSSLGICFKQFPPLRASGAEAWVGLQTSNDERFLRLWWEIDRNSDWKPFPKGGHASPYLADIHLKVNWANNGREMKAFHDHLNSIGKSTPGNGPRRSFPFYFAPGLTWVYRTERFHVQPLPAGCITSTRGPGIYSSNRLSFLLGYLNSSIADILIKVLLGRHIHPQFDIDDVNALPIPSVNDTTVEELGIRAWSIRNVLMKSLEEYAGTYHGLLYTNSIKSTLHELYTASEKNRKQAITQLEHIQTEIDQASMKLLNIADEHLLVLRELMVRWDDFGVLREDKQGYVHRCISYLVGCNFGRWNIGHILREPDVAEADQPFAELPICPPGMLQNDVGLPAALSDVSATYPLRISWAGILVDDPGHPDDMDTRIREVIGIIWGEKRDEIYEEAAQSLRGGGNDLRPWFQANFFEEHIKRYSKSHRKAPIYWCLSTPSRSYAVWLYYHRFGKDTLYKVLNDYVTPKVQHEERQLNKLRNDAGENPMAGQRTAIEVQEAFVGELWSFREELFRVAPLWNPDLNDGVLINFAPLWRLAPHPKSWQKECKQTWDALVRGDYDWAHLAMHLWPERVVPKCTTDRSLAIAHGLEDALWREGKDGKWTARNLDDWEIENLVEERTSSAVKAALVGLLDAPVTEPTKKAPVGKAKRGGRVSAKSAAGSMQTGMNFDDGAS